MKLVLAGSVAAAVVAAVLFAHPSSPATAQASDARQQFIGNWELLSYVSISESGQVTDMNYIGRILYDELGNMSAIGMPRDLPSRPRAEGQPPPRAGFAYFSTFDVEPEHRRVIHHVIASPMNPAWVGTDLVRYYEFEEDRLALSIRNAEGRVTGTLTWRRMR